MIAEKEQKLRNIVEIAYNTLEAINDNSTLSDTEKKQQAKNFIKTMRYNSDDYLWINDLKPAMVMHPIKPEMDGKDLSNYQDSNGKLLFVEFVKVCQAKSEGMVDYLWPKPGFEKPVPKFSYVKLFKPWGWIIGTGIYVEDIDAVIASKNQAIEHSIFRQSLFLVVAIVMTLIIAAAIAGLIVKRAVDYIKKCVEFSEKLSSGDLTQQIEVKVNDEIGVLIRSLNVMVKKIKENRDELIESRKTVDLKVRVQSEILAMIGDSSEKVAARANKSEDSCVYLTENLTNQFELLSEINKMMSDIDIRSAHSADKAREATNITVQAGEMAEAGNGKMRTMLTAMDEISSSSQEISKILDVLQDISDQVNLLALNATIEAARAGEAGRGFAVVANEVKDLALRSSKAVKETSELLEKSARNVDNGGKIAQETSLSLEQILDRIADVTKIAGEISNGSTIQAESITQVKKMLDDANHEVQQMRNAAESTSENAGELSQHSNELVTQLNLKLKETEKNFGAVEIQQNSRDDSQLWSEKRTAPIAG